MAVTAKVAKVSLRIQANGGTDPEGKPIVNYKTVSDINKAATNDNLVAGAKSIASLYTDTYEGAQKITTEDLTEA